MEKVMTGKESPSGRAREPENAKRVGKAMARPEQTLEEHLRNVSARCKEFCGDFGAPTWGELVGMAHDWGKRSSKWQEYLAKGGREERRQSPGHAPQSVADLAAAFPDEMKPFALIAAYCVRGHHGRLPDWNSTFGNEFQEPEKAGVKIREPLPPELLPHGGIAELLPKLQAERDAFWQRGAAGRQDGAADVFADIAFFIRMLHSACVDADRLDAESVESPETNAKRGGRDDFAALERKFEEHMKRFSANAAKTPVNAARAEILEACRSKAESANGFFTLEAPTGGGKTLSAMAFAMKHLRRNGMKRIVVAIPFKSIIEQTAQTYRDIFGKDNVLEHHSNFDFSEGEAKKGGKNGKESEEEQEATPAELAAENWDAPIIVTTTVQLFESLLQGKAGSARKIHNLAKSVIVLDEAQKLPPNHLNAILSTLRSLVFCCGSTVVLCSATIPDLTGIINEGDVHPIRGLNKVEPILGNAETLAKTLCRTTLAPRISIAMRELAERLAQEEQVLCIVNTRSKCLDLFGRVRESRGGENTRHLSALMCPADRRRTLEEIRKKVAEGAPIAVVATSIVEAGVDLDFHTVWRELAGLDSIAQAAGRCNREGRRETGTVQVFEFADEALKSPPSFLSRSIASTLHCVQGDEFPELTPSVYRKFFRQLLRKSKDILNSDKFKETFVNPSNYLWAPKRNVKENESDSINNYIFCGKYDYATFGDEFKMIDSQASLIVLYGESPSLVERLRREGPSRSLFRALQQYAVNICKRDMTDLAESGCIEPLHGLWVQRQDGIYEEGRGVRLTTEANALICD